MNVPGEVVPSTVATAGGNGCQTTITRKTNTVGRTGQVNHIEVVTGHELDIELLPCSSLVWAPPNRARATLLEDISGTWFCGRDVRQSNQGEGQKKGRESATRQHR